MEATLGGGRPAGRPQGRCLPPTLRSPPWRRRWEEGGQRVAPRAVARRRRFGPHHGGGAGRRAASGSPPGPMRRGPAVRTPARPQVTTGRAARPSFAGVGGEGAARRSDGSTRRPPALLREGWSCHRPRPDVAFRRRPPRPGANARTATGDGPKAAARQGQGAGGTPCIASQIPNSASRQCIPFGISAMHPR